MNTERTPHDAAYKQFFSNPEMVASLLRDFVPEDFVSELDFSTQERYPGSWVTGNLRERHDDIVWRVGWKKGRWCYVVLLLEFQSTPDHWMALRMLSYTALLLLDLVKSGQVEQKEGLPPVFPLVIYNGSRNWQAPKDVSELFADMPGSLRAFCPRHRYFLLDDGRTSPETLERATGLSALLLRLERARNIDEARGIIKELIVRLATPEYQGLRREFTVWLHRVVLRRMDIAQDVEEFHDLQEVDDMLEERVPEWKNDYIWQGRKLGREEGMALGREEGMTLGREEGMALGREEGMSLGREEGFLSALVSLVEDGLLPVGTAAAQAKMSEEEFVARMKKLEMPNQQ
ncbi:MAG: Rpn family recombination-promoting nuclease/putative transposase [Deltaproteobacteria bacterium]|nr:Rpn family recombination-promoting nuclease/putative transposase [Deltaproteobacteria bacterium]